jgi:hypothetical protein
MTTPSLPPQRHDRCALMLSHRLSGVTLSNFAAARATMGATHDVILLLTEPLAEEARALGLEGRFVILEKDEIFVPAYRRKSALRRIVPGNPDLVMLAFWRARPDYAAYWLLEYDVLMPKGYGALAEICAASRADLLASRVRTYVDRPDWGHWRTLGAPDGPVPEARRHGAFMPLSRFSQALMRELDRAYGSGWHGHHECAVATIARHAGLAVTELNSEAQAVLGRPIMSPVGFRVKDCKPTRPDFAHHPVKTGEEARMILSALGIEPEAPAPTAAPVVSDSELLAALEEASAHLSLARHHAGGADRAIPAALRRVQEDLARLCAMLRGAPGGGAAGLEAELSAPGPQPAAPPGGLAAGHAYLAGAIARRAAAIALRPRAETGGPLPPEVLRYVSLLPDHLHVLAHQLDQR